LEKQRPNSKKSGYIKYSRNRVSQFEICQFSFDRYLVVFAEALLRKANPIFYSVSDEYGMSRESRHNMPRKVVPPNSEFPYHVNVRCINREWFEIPMDEVWAIMEDYLFFIHHAYEIEIISFVLMNNHFHMIVRSPKANLSEAMNYFMRETSKQIAARSGRINQIYGGRFHRTLIEDPHYFNAAYKYVYRNPYEAGLCNLVQDYRYSTLFRKLGSAPLHFPVAYDSTLFFSYDDTLRWLNRTPLPEDTEQVVKALKRLVFKLPTDRRTGRPPDLSTREY